jgi:putative transposase
MELRSVIVEEVERTKRRSGLRVREILAVLGVGRSAYYSWRSAERKVMPGPRGVERTNCYSLLPGEREEIIRYALRHPDVRHRELAWKMVDDNVVCVSPSTVYRVLKEENLVAPRVKRKKRYHQPSGWASAPDERWQSDLRYVKIKGKSYYLIMFLDEYSRYVVHWELMPSMDGNSVALAAADALSKLDGGRRPDIQTDNGSGYVSREFKMVLSDHGIGHHRIRPHTPEDNSLVERVHRTVGEALDEFEVETDWEARERIAEIVEWYNHRRLHSGINFLRPIDYYRGDPERLLRIRQCKIEQARHHRKEENLKRKQKTLFFAFPQGPEPLISATCEKSSFL